MAARITVCVITYNHEQYLREALEGAVSQRGAFELKIVVGVDHSSDGTAQIAQEFERRYPGIVKLILHPTRVGMMPNFRAVFAETAGADFVALLEGDDRWTSPDKLARQVEFLEANAGCTVCYHDATIKYEGPNPFVASAPNAGVRSRWNFDEFLLAPHVIQTCTVLYRNVLNGDLPEWMMHQGVGDWPLHVLHASHGWVGRIPIELAEYRSHPGGVWSGAMPAVREKRLVSVYRELDRHFHGRYHDAFSALLYSRFLNIACVTDDKTELSWALKEASTLSRRGSWYKWPYRVKVKWLLGYRLMRLWRVVAYGSAAGREGIKIAPQADSSSEVFTRSVLIGLSSAAAMVANLVATKCYAMWLGPQGIGILALGRSFAWALSTLTGAALGSVLIRTGAVAMTQAGTQSLADLRLGALRLSAISMSVACAAVAARVPLSRWLFDSAEYGWVVAAAATAGALTVLAAIQMGTLTALGDHRGLARTTAGAGVVASVAGIVGVWHLRLYGVAAVLLVPPVLTLLLVGRRIAGSIPVARAAPVRILALSALPLSVSALVGGIVEYLLPIVLVQDGDTSTVGLFRAPYMLAIGALAWLGTVMAQEYYPRISAVPDELLSASVNRQLRLVTLFAAIVAFVGALGARQAIIFFFSHDFSGSAPLLVTLLAANVARLPSWCLSHAVLARSSPHAYLVLEIAGGALLLGFTALGLRSAGLFGVGLGVTAGYVAYFLCAWVVLCRTTSYRMDSRTLLSWVTLFGCTMALALSW